MAKIENGTLTISAAYGVKVPGEADFSSQEARLAIDLSYPVSGEYDSIVDGADTLEAALVTQLKLAVFAQLGLGVEEREDGSIGPDFSTLPARRSGSSGKSFGGGPKGGGGGGGNGGQRAPSKAATAGYEIPVVTVSIDGQTIDVQDLREAKARGIYKSNAPDFRVGDNGYWLTGKDGSVNPKTAQLRDAVDAAAPFESDDSAVW